MYSQNSEEQIILNHFGKTKGTFLDIGAYDGINLSNTHALAKKGWKGFCLEPSPTMFKKLYDNYKTSRNVLCLNIGISNKSGKVEFWDNPNAVATAIKEEVARWPNEAFTLTEARMRTWDEFYAVHKFMYDFISIDAEGMDYEILSQINLTEAGCEMLCVEWNGINKDKYVVYCADYGMKLVHENLENLIFTKQK